MHTQKKQTKPTGRPRRGALLLVVLSMLITFLLLGTVLVTLATRSRTAASAYAAAMAPSNNEAGIARELLDEALMQLVRGSAARPADECILGDKYGQGATITGTATDISATGPVIELTLELNSDSGRDSSKDYLDLNGRVMTFAPTPSQGGSMSSYRILRTTPGGQENAYRCVLANIRPQPDATLPPDDTSVKVYVNPHEFHAEPHDSFADDLWLTQLTLSGAETPVLAEPIRPAFGAVGTATVDNDNDGVFDGVWLRNQVPDRVLNDGRTLRYELSYLVTDLDSRLNLNAHGSPARLKPNGQPYSPADWGSGIPQVDPGFGWGVADIDISALFPDDSNVFGRLLGGDSQNRPYTDEPNVIRKRPKLLGVDGRYGRGEQPAPGSSQTGVPNASASDYEKAVYRLNPTVDLAAMIKVFADPGNTSTGAPPSLQYRVPSDYTPTFIDDPYEARLDSDAPRLNSFSSAGTGNDDNLFTLSELERVLRQFDADANALPQRLAGLLGDRAQALRMLVTTDSWDTPLLTGTWASFTQGDSAHFKRYTDSLTPQQVYGMLSPDIAAGLRFDINRPFELVTPTDPLSAETAESKEAYCRDLYCMLCALLHADLEGADPSADPSPYEILAQWVVNVVDYRDADSTSTRFTYDTDLTDGWNPGADSVQGHEQISLLLAETYGWFTTGGAPTSGLAVQLYRPDEPSVIQENGGTSQKPCDAALRGPNGHIDICKQTPGNDPIWRLRYSDDTGESYVRFDKVRATDLNANHGYTASNTSFQDTMATLEIPPDGFVCVYPGQDESLYTFEDEKPNAPNAFVKLKVDQGKKMGFVGATAANGRYVVYLERLSDPAQDFDQATNPYVSVNKFTVKHEQKPSNGSDAKSVRRCPYHFWETPDDFYSFGGHFAPLPRQGRQFLVWPDRPFVSQAELAMVPTTAPGEVYSSPVSPTETPHHYLSVLAEDVATAIGTTADKDDIASKLIPAILDATYVPSRFLGSAVTVPNPAVNLDKVGMEKIPFRQLSRYREPGRVNINTMPHTAFANNAIAKAVISGTGAPTVFASQNPFHTTPAKRWIDVFQLGNASDAFFYDSTATQGGSNTCNGNCGPGDVPAPTQGSLYPLLGLRTAVRMGNVATMRSHVFAVWITLKTTDTTSQKDTYHRLFAIVDRSVPTAYRQGENLNSHETIRLKRYID